MPNAQQYVAFLLFVIILQSQLMSCLVLIASVCWKHKGHKSTKYQYYFLFFLHICVISFWHTTNSVRTQARTQLKTAAEKTPLHCFVVLGSEASRRLTLRHLHRSHTGSDAQGEGEGRAWIREGKASRFCSTQTTRQVRWHVCLHHSRDLITFMTAVADGIDESGNEVDDEHP